MAPSSATIERRIEVFVEALKAKRLRLTHQRLEIFREIAQTEEHPDAEAIFDGVRTRMPTVSLDTVYRTLSLLEKEGLISRVDVLPARGRFDSNRDHHHHFVCTECGLIRDFYSPDLDDLPAPESVSAFGDVRTIHVQIRGVCRACRARRQSTDHVR